MLRQEKILKISRVGKGFEERSPASAANTRSKYSAASAMICAGLRLLHNETSICRASRKHCDLHFVIRHSDSEFDERTVISPKTYQFARQFGSAGTCFLQVMELTIGVER